MLQTVPPKVTFKRATYSDAPYIVALCKELHSLGSYRHIEFDYQYTLNFVRNACSSTDWYVMGAIDEGGTYVGFVAGMLCPMVFTTRRIGIEHAWYVREGTPGRGRTAKRLMQGFVDWCIMEKGAMHVQAGDVANINSVAVDGLYRLLKFKRAGTIYMYKETE